MNDTNIGAKEMVLKSRRKWFWIGIVISLFLPPIPGFIFGFALLTEKPYRKEALIIIIWTIVWAILTYLMAQYIVSHGLRVLVFPQR